MSESSEEEQLHQLRYSVYESDMKAVLELVSKWDRKSVRDGNSTSPLERSDGQEASGTQGMGQSSKRSKPTGSGLSGKKVSQTTTKDGTSNSSPTGVSGASLPQPIESLVLCPQTLPQDLESLADLVKLPALGVPNIVLDMKKTADEETEHVTFDFGRVWQVLDHCLPSMDLFLDSCGLGPSGPPIPEPVLFSVIQYSQLDTSGSVALVNRQPTNFIFIASGPDDPNVPCNSTTIDQTMADTITKSVSNQPVGTGSSVVGRSASSVKKSTSSKGLTGDHTAESSHITLTTTSAEKKLLPSSGSSVLGKSRRDSKFTETMGNKH
ncbi:hypothetical protein Ciccas_009302 [Cichlidogyrus casuarinus]|uniref:Uncharacterized protein n=1 Tax=Cichlidogyrus casuarinus TaxID=1844966 RepID=A0ABD2PXN1_9PLAT